MSVDAEFCTETQMSDYSQEIKVFQALAVRDMTGVQGLLNPLTPKICLLILPISCCTFPCKLVTRIWCSIKIISCT